MLKSTQNEFLILKKPNQTQFLNQIKCLFQISDLMYTSAFLLKKKSLELSYLVYFANHVHSSQRK